MKKALHHRQSHGESCPFAKLAFDGDGSAMKTDVRSDNGKSESGAVRRCGNYRRDKTVRKYAAELSFGMPMPCVGNSHDIFATVDSIINFDLAAFRRVDDGIVYQIVKSLTHHKIIAHDKFVFRSGTGEGQALYFFLPQYVSFFPIFLSKISGK